MPQSPEVADLSQNLLSAYRAAQEALDAEMESIQADPTKWRRQSRLRELQRNVERITDSLDQQAADFFSTDFPTIYSLGAQVVDYAEFSWTQSDRFAISQLAQETFSELLEATQLVDDSTKALIRRLSKSEALLGQTTGKTATQAGRDLAKLLEKYKVHAVVYADGSKHGIGDYSDMLIRTKGANAYNLGTLNFGGRTGTKWYEIADGFGCGMSSHDDPDKANRTIRSAEECAAYTLSHPRCLRSFLPRPELRTKQDAQEAPSLISDVQQLDQTAVETQRAVDQQRRAQSRRRAEARRNRRAAVSGGV